MVILMEMTRTLDIPLESGTIMIKFSAVWCAPCKRIEPILQKLKSEFDMIKFFTIDVDEYPELASKYNVKCVPTLLVLKNGQEVNRVTGVSLIEPLRKILRDSIDI